MSVKRRYTTGNKFAMENIYLWAMFAFDVHRFDDVVNFKVNPFLGWNRVKIIWNSFPF